MGPAAPLPRVAQFVPRQRSGQFTSAQHDARRPDHRSNAMGSVIFPDGEQLASQPMRASSIEISKTSADHPLKIHDMSDLHQTYGSRMLLPRREPPQQHSAGFAAGRSSAQSMAVRTVLTGELPPEPPPAAAVPQRRHEYQHPSYQIRRSGASEVKDLLYGGAPPPPAAQPAAAAGLQGPAEVPPGHPLAQVYGWLRTGISSAPRDGDGNTDERVLRAALDHVGLDLSIDGFAELLARCDISDEGFPAFDDFVRCVGRPHRVPPHEDGPSVEPPGDEAPARADDPPLSEPPPPPPPPPQMQLQPPQPSAPAPAQGHQVTWRHMQVSDDMENRRPPSKHGAQPGMAGNTGSMAMTGTARLGVAPPKPVSSFPLGSRPSVPTLGSNVGSMYAKKHGVSYKFSGTFDPDHYF